jgi:hypothetical protein
VNRSEQKRTIARSGENAPPDVIGAAVMVFSGGHKFDAETTRIMEMAFEMALVAPRLADRADVANEVRAHFSLRALEPALVLLVIN